MKTAKEFVKAIRALMARIDELDDAGKPFLKEKQLLNELLVEYRRRFLRSERKAAGMK